MTLQVTPDGSRLDAGRGEAPWSADRLTAYKTTGAKTGGRYAMAEATTAHGSESPARRDLHEDEAWYVLDGELRFRLAGTGSAGDTVCRPRDLEHRFELTSTEALFFLYVTPAGFEGCSRFCGSPVSILALPPADLPPKGEEEVLAGASRTYRLEIFPSCAATTTQGDKP